MFGHVLRIEASLFCGLPVLHARESLRAQTCGRTSKHATKTRKVVSVTKTGMSVVVQMAGKALSKTQQHKPRTNLQTACKPSMARASQQHQQQQQSSNNHQSYHEVCHCHKCKQPMNQQACWTPHFGASFRPRTGWYSSWPALRLSPGFVVLRVFRHLWHCYVAQQM